MGNIITKLFKGLFRDSAPQDQPKGTHRFALNAVNESREGDLPEISNEEGNELCAYLPNDYIPLGKEYIGNGQTVILSTRNDDSYSQIGILDANCNYTPHVNHPLGFRTSNQIDVTFRLRRGCERVIYWVDGDANEPRIYNFDKPNDFKTAGAWDIKKFSLFKNYSKIPIFEDIIVEEFGNLLPGGYNITIRYLDADLNPTEFITTSDVITINNDSYSKKFSEIRGSTNLETGYQMFGKTSKSIRVIFDNLDESFPYYQVGIVEANAGTGFVNRVVYSAIIPISINTYLYTGDNGESEGTEEEVQAFNNIIDGAGSIEQIENRLTLGDVIGKQINFCGLQRYASKIKADLILKEIVLNSIEVEGNQKRGTALFEGIGYMPGEIYSFGIVYVFEDGTVSPVFHIPGRNPNYVSDMDTDNVLENTFYTSEDCGNSDYWGEDSEGISLKNDNVRHHRFPLRSTIGEPLVVKSGVTTSTNIYTLYIDVTGTIDPAYPNDDILLEVVYTINGVSSSFETSINVASYNPATGLQITIVSSSNIITFVSATEINPNGTPASTLSNLVYTDSVVIEQVDIENAVYTTNILGIKFSDIDLPDAVDSGGEQIIGYYIVRNERTQEEKTILDTGVITPLIEEPYYVAHGHLMPILSNGSRVKKDAFALIHPEHRFFGHEYKNATSLLQEGTFLKSSFQAKSTVTEDVMAGTSYDPEVAKNREEDVDGFDLHTLVRNNTLVYQATALSEFANVSTNLSEIFYLDALHSKSITDSIGGNKEIFNVASDNKIGIVQLNIGLSSTDAFNITNSLPYVIITKILSDPYGNFRVTPYYKESHNFQFFNLVTEEVELFAGDSYVSPMRYSSMMYFDTRLRERDSKDGIWNIILGVILIIVGAIVTVLGAVYSAGTASVLGIMIIGYGVSQLSTGITKDQIANTYQAAYEAGLKDCVDDLFTDVYFGPNPDDDQIQWLADILTNVWFETSANTNWRQGATLGIPDFYNSPVNPVSNLVAESGTTISKLTKLDTQAANGRLYQGFANAELYQINPDYLRGNKQKIFFHLPFEYDCCSDCLEEFPHRVHYSEQSFQEELSDNYRVFLPNNYIDIEGETGRITDLFRIQNNLYIHTEEALWHLPQTLQERVTGDIISFIGTGDFFGIPPRKIVDDETGNSGGTRHKWGTIKTPYGVMFISEAQGVVFRFDGNNLTPISNEGLYNWFKENLKVVADNQYLSDTGEYYPYANNPSNPIGTGFVAVYDSRYERVIFTKRDFEIDPELIDSDDYRIVYCGGEVIIFRDYKYTLGQRHIAGWTFNDVQDCQLSFSRIVDEVRVEEFVAGELLEGLSNTNCSYTISYSIKTNSWTGWHSYLPEFYLNTPDKFYSWISGQTGLWKHNAIGLYNNFYGVKYPFIVEYASLAEPLNTKVWEYIILQTTARKLDSATNEYMDQRFVTFNKAILYNNRQCSGLLNIKVKDENLNVNYLREQVTNAVGEVIADRNERNWTINDLRDYRVDYDVPIFNSNKQALQGDYYIDKILNAPSIDQNKDWSQVESFRDKYLVIRLIFDKFDDVKLILNYSVENENESPR